MTGLKNISKAEVLTLKDEVAYQKGQVVSKTLAQNAALSVTLFSFDKGEEISTHESGGDAFVTCLDGMGRITIDESKPRTLTAAASGDALETVRQRVCLEMADGGKIYMDCSMEKPRTAPVRVSFEGVLDAKRMKSRVGRIVRCRPSDE